MADKLENPVLMAVIGAPHGIRGELRVKSFTGDPASLGNYGPLFSSDGRRFEVHDVRPANEVAVVRFKGVADRNAAEALNGTELFVDRSMLPDDIDEDEFYHADLVGLTALDTEGKVLGTVKAVQNYGGGDILVLALDGRDEVLVPFSRAAVPHVDIAGGRLHVEPVGAGLVDLDDSDIPGAPIRPGRGTGGFDPRRRPRGPKDAGGNR